MPCIRALTAQYLLRLRSHIYVKVDRLIYVISTTNMMHTSLPHSLYYGSKSPHVSGITCPSSGDTTRAQIWWLLCAVVNVGLSRDVGRLLREGKGATIS
jgi:hypothetical protein